MFFQEYSRATSCWLRFPWLSSWWMWLVFLDTTVSWVKTLQCKCLQFPHINLTVILTQPLTRYSDTHTYTQTGTCASTALFVCHVQHLVHRQTALSKQDLLDTRLRKYGLNKSVSTVIMINVVSGILQWSGGLDLSYAYMVHCALQYVCLQLSPHVLQEPFPESAAYFQEHQE